MPIVEWNPHCPRLETNDTDATVAEAFAALDAMSAQMVRTGVRVLAAGLLGIWRQGRTYPLRYAGDLGGVMRVGLIRFPWSPRPPTSVCDLIKLQTYFEGAGLALCCGPRRVGRDMQVGLLLVRRLSDNERRAS
jgi:hypothetical protein